MRVKTIITKRINLLLLVTMFVIPIQSQNRTIGDSIMIVKNQTIDGHCVRYDTFSLQSVNDSKIINRTWYLDQFYSSLNDSISLLFRYGLEKAYLKFGQNWSIGAYDGCYGFGGLYRISKDKRIVIKTAGSKSIYCKKDTLNIYYQKFWRSFVPLLHESKYKIFGDSLILFHHTGYMLFLDSNVATVEYLKTKKWPEKKDININVDQLLKELIKE